MKSGINREDIIPKEVQKGSARLKDANKRSQSAEPGSRGAKKKKKKAKCTSTYVCQTDTPVPKIRVTVSCPMHSLRLPPETLFASWDS